MVAQRKVAKRTQKTVTGSARGIEIAGAILDAIRDAPPGPYEVIGIVVDQTFDRERTTVTLRKAPQKSRE
jgi:hypothetical protein